MSSLIRAKIVSVHGTINGLLYSREVDLVYHLKISLYGLKQLYRASMVWEIYYCITRFSSFITLNQGEEYFVLYNLHLSMEYPWDILEEEGSYDITH